MSFECQTLIYEQKESRSELPSIGPPTLKIVSPSNAFGEESHDSFLEGDAEGNESSVQRTQVSQISNMLANIRLELQSIHLKDGIKHSQVDSMNKVANSIQQIRYLLLCGRVSDDLVRKLIELRFDSSTCTLLTLLVFSGQSSYNSLSSATQIEDSLSPLTPTSFDKYFAVQAEKGHWISKLTEQIEKMRKWLFEIKNYVLEIVDKNEPSQLMAETQIVFSLFEGISIAISEAETAISDGKATESRLLDEHGKLFLKLEKERARSAQATNELAIMASALGKLTRPLGSVVVPRAGQSEKHPGKDGRPPS